jgi:hypothetical protein
VHRITLTYWVILNHLIFQIPIVIIQQGYTILLLIKIYKTATLPFILYGYETLVFHPKGRTLGALEYKVLRRIFGPRREKMKGGWRKLHNEQLYNLNASP